MGSDLVGGTPGTDYVSCDHCRWRGPGTWGPRRAQSELKEHFREEHPEKLPAGGEQSDE